MSVGRRRSEPSRDLGRAPQTEGMAGARALGWLCTWHVSRLARWLLWLEGVAERKADRMSADGTQARNWTSKFKVKVKVIC